LEAVSSGPAAIGFRVSSSPRARPRHWH
jgi:hypothetical protein